MYVLLKLFLSRVDTGEEIVLAKRAIWINRFRLEGCR